MSRRSASPLGVVHPAAVMGALTLLAWANGDAPLNAVAWSAASSKIAIVGASTIVAALLTEEGFFRGWLWAAYEHRGLPPRRTLLVTSVTFALWHVSSAVLPTGFDLPLDRVPIFIANTAVLGAVWGVLRWSTGSVVASSIAHGIWNGAAYVLFGVGAKIGGLGIRDTALYGPEVGLLGLLLNVVFLAALWATLRPDRRRSPSLDDEASERMEWNRIS